MKREIRRDVVVKPFTISLAELSLIWTKLEPLFADVNGKSFYVDVEFRGEKLTLESIEELQNTAFPDSRSTDFTLHCHGSTCSLHLYTPPHAGSLPKLIVTSDSEVWAAGAREAVVSVLNQNRAWHHWIHPGVLTMLMLLAGAVFIGALAFERAGMASFQSPTMLGMAGTVAVLALLALGRPFLLPTATLRLKEKESFWRRYSTELTLALALVSALLTAYGLLSAKGGA